MNDFFYFRLPNESEIYALCEPNDTGAIPCEIEVFPFLKNESTLKFKSKFVKKVSAFPDFLPNDLPEFSDFNQLENQEGYHDIVKMALQKITEGKALKIVTSRMAFQEQVLKRSSSLLENLGKKYPNALVFFYKNGNQCWLGATPEILYMGYENVFYTMSLAGTIANLTASLFTEKEQQEQKWVTQEIVNRLTNFSHSIKVSPPIAMEYGNMKHLSTHIHAELLPSTSIEEMAQNLSPTPAVCGLPREYALQFICEYEIYSREYYTGYISIHFKEKKYGFVQLRSAKVCRNGMLYYAGGGIVSGSQPEQEWEETELKLKSIR